MSGKRLRVYIADDHPLFLAGISRTVKLRPEFELVGSSSDGRSALTELRTLVPDVAVLDLQMPGLGGLAVIEAVEREQLPVKVLVVSAHVERELVYGALAAGARGFLSKLTPEEEVCDAIARIARGHSIIADEVAPTLLSELRGRRDRAPQINERERSILHCLAEGMTAPMIAERLHVSPATVRTQLQGLYEKLGVNTQAAAVATAIRQGLVD